MHQKLHSREGYATFLPFGGALGEGPTGKKTGHSKFIFAKVRLAAAKTPQDQAVLQRQIAASDRQIDQLVYELYDLTEEEIRLVEEGTNGGCAFSLGSFPRCHAERGNKESSPVFHPGSRRTPQPCHAAAGSLTSQQPPQQSIGVPPRRSVSPPRRAGDGAGALFHQWFGGGRLPERRR
jgi:hypothetical protein